MARNNIPNVNIENAKIRFRNFTGEPTKFNKAGGKITFSVVLEPELAQRLIEDGWNVKTWEPEGGDEPVYHMPVEASYNLYPPKIYMISGKKKTLLTQDTIAALQYAEYENVDIVIRPYCWEVNEKSGVKAYVKSMYVTIVEDEFEKKYRELDEDDNDDDDDALPF